MCFVVLIGRSGSGKSTAAREIAALSRGKRRWGIIDVDDFWVSDDAMPRVHWTDGNGVVHHKKLYDSIESIDWARVSQALARAYMQYDGVIFTTFVYPQEVFAEHGISLRGWTFIEFDIDESTSIQRRRISKAQLVKKKNDGRDVRTFDEQFDEWMVRCYATPFYEKHITIVRERYNPVVIDGRASKENVLATIFDTVKLRI